MPPLIIVGLRRSGTTAFWQAFRQDERLLCFNEPYNPVLIEMPEELPNRSRRELIALFEEDPARFWEIFAPVGRVEELQEGLSDRQQAWTRVLLGRADQVAFDTTRCHFKLEALKELAPDAVLVHLHRHPAAMATSHLAPSASGGRPASRLRRWRGERGFFTRERGFNSWGLEELIGRRPESLFGQRLRAIGLDPAEVYRLPAVGRLLAFWRLAWERAEADGRRLFGERFVSVQFERFCLEPEAILAQVYAALGLERPAFDASAIHPANRPHREQDPRWEDLFGRLGIPQEALAR